MKYILIGLFLIGCCEAKAFDYEKECRELPAGTGIIHLCNCVGHDVQGCCLSQRESREQIIAAKCKNYKIELEYKQMQIEKWRKEKK